LFVTDKVNHRVRKVSTVTGETSTFAGKGRSGYTDGFGTNARFNLPSGLALSSASATSHIMYVADSFNNRIRYINLTTSEVVTFAGSRIPEYVDGTGTAAGFYNPIALTTDTSGNIYISDQDNHMIRQSTSDAVITRFAGSGNATYLDGVGENSSFHYPYGITIDTSGNLYVADSLNYRIRKISTSRVVSTLAGSGNAARTDGLGTSASFSYPVGIAIDDYGRLYVTDAVDAVIRRILPTGFVTTIAGIGSSNTSFSYPIGIVVTSNYDLYVADGERRRILTVSSTGSVLDAVIVLLCNSVVLKLPVHAFLENFIMGHIVTTYLLVTRTIHLVYRRCDFIL
jgi:sugar lactone lactonase YvrE